MRESMAPQRNSTPFGVRRLRYASMLNRSAIVEGQTCSVFVGIAASARHISLRILSFFLSMALAVSSLEVSAQTTKTLSTVPAYNWYLTSGGGPYETQQDALNARYNYLRSYYRPCFQFSLGNLRVWTQSTYMNGLPTWYVFDLTYT